MYTVTFYSFCPYALLLFFVYLYFVYIITSSINIYFSFFFSEKLWHIIVSCVYISVCPGLPFIMQQMFMLTSSFQLQLASLLSLNSSKADTEYLNHLEESLALARTQLADSGKRCRDLEAQLSAVVNPQVSGIGSRTLSFWSWRFVLQMKVTFSCFQTLSNSYLKLCLCIDPI